MKKLIFCALNASLTALTSITMAQEKKKDTLKIGEGIDRPAKKVVNATASTTEGWKRSRFNGFETRFKDLG